MVVENQGDSFSLLLPLLKKLSGHSASYGRNGGHKATLTGHTTQSGHSASYERYGGHKATLIGHTTQSRVLCKHTLTKYARTTSNTRIIHTKRHA